MRLSAELFDQIIAALKSDRQKDRDKRLEPRVGMAGEATLVFLKETGKKASAKVRVRDVSYGGVGLYYSKRFAEGQRLIIQLQSIISEPVWLICNTAYCRKLEPDRFSIGARISQVLRSDQITAIEHRPGSIESLLTDISNASPSNKEEARRIAKAILA